MTLWEDVELNHDYPVNDNSEPATSHLCALKPVSTQALEFPPRIRPAHYSGIRNLPNAPRTVHLRSPIPMLST